MDACDALTFREKLAVLPALLVHKGNVSSSE